MTARALVDETRLGYWLRHHGYTLPSQLATERYRITGTPLHEAISVATGKTNHREIPSPWRNTEESLDVADAATNIFTAPTCLVQILVDAPHDEHRNRLHIAVIRSQNALILRDCAPSIETIATETGRAATELTQSLPTIQPANIPTCHTTKPALQKIATVIQHGASNRAYNDALRGAGIHPDTAEMLLNVAPTMATLGASITAWVPDPANAGLVELETHAWATPYGWVSRTQHDNHRVTLGPASLTSLTHAVSSAIQAAHANQLAHL